MPLYVALGHADIALFSDPIASRVTLNRLQGFQRTRKFDRARVLFEGDEHPTDFRGTGRGRTYNLTSRYLASEHADLVALLDLFEASFDAPDGRLQLRTHLGLVGGLNPYEVVTVDEVDERPVDGAESAFDVSFVASTVLFSVEV